MQGKSIIKNSVRIVLLTLLLMVLVQGVQAEEWNGLLINGESPGIGDGQFNDARSAAINSSGNVYVADKNNDRIQMVLHSLTVPTLTNISPTYGTVNGGTLVTLTGTDFTGATAVTFGGTSATSYTVISDTQITATTPAHAIGTVTVSVTTPVGSASLANVYTYQPAQIPTFTSISPTYGTINGGTLVTITGTGFTGASQVTLGGLPVSGMTVVSDTSINGTSPAHAAGAVDVVVVTPGGTAYKANAYTYQAAQIPTITSISPVYGTINGGTFVTITGTGFTGANQVTLGGSPVSNLTVVSDTSINATSPAHAAGSVDVVVVTPDGTAQKVNAYTYVDPAIVPVITGISPATGTTNGGTLVTITGTGFTGATAITFGGTSATSYTVNSDTQITATSPAHAVGAVTVVVTTLGGSASIANAYTYTAATVLTITSISPATGTTNGGTLVTITGTGFTGATAVTFGGTSATSYSVNSDTQITATSPAHTAGIVDIIVITPTGESAISAADKFTYVSSATNGSVIEQGATIFIGEGGLNVTNSLNAAQGLPNGSIPTNTVIGWWGSSAVISTTTPTKTVNLATRYMSMTVAPADFVGYTGNWYLVNLTTGFGGNRVFTVADPSLSMGVWDFLQASDVTGRSVLMGDPLGFQINTNMYAAVDGRYRSNPIANGGTFPNAATDGYITIKVRDPNSVTYSALQVGAPGTSGTTTSLLGQFVSTQPWYFGFSKTNAWITNATDNTNQSVYPLGTYSTWAESTLNNMKENYRNGGADYTGKTVSSTGTVSLVRSTVAPVASFNVTPISGTAPLTVKFTDLSTNYPSSWSWSFGDGSLVNATVQNPVHTYNSAGIYTVALTATNTIGSNTLIQTNYITIIVTKWGTPGSGDGQFSNPQGITTDSSGNIYVADRNNNRIQKFSSTGTFLAKWGSQGIGYGQFSQPWSVAVDSSGNSYVSDYGNNRIQKFDSSGVFTKTWGGPGSGDGQFRSPGGVAVDYSGNVYVADYGNNRIQKFDSTGTFITKWGILGSGDGQFSQPWGVTVDSSGNVYVSDYGNNRIQKFSSTGTFLTKWGTQGSGDGQFFNPLGVAIDSSGNVYVTDYGNNRIQKFSLTGTFITKWGTQGSGDGQFSNPIGVALDSSSNVYVSDTGNNRIQKFAPSQTTTTSTVGIFRTGSFFLASSNSNGGGTVNFFGYGQTGDMQLAGDWNGDGTDTVGIYRTDPYRGAFYLASSNIAGGGNVNAFNYGMAGDVPVAGDWNGDGTDTVGIFRNGAFFLASSNENGGGTVNAFTFGQAGDVPVAGDWNGDGTDTVGIFRNGAFFLASKNENGGGTVNFFGYGQAGDMPVVGDWNKDGATEAGIYRTDPYRGAFFLASSNIPGGGDVNAFTYGMAGDVPVAGKWT
jgi:PKD repeat protein